MEQIYGIDLGTTNSLIGLGNELIGTMLPSIVDIDKKIAGESERDNTNAKRSFKVDISMSVSGTMPIVASRYVLEELNHMTGDKAKKVVISVPAYFKDNQRQATIKAAELAGMEVVALVNEPTAAAMYISKSVKTLSVIYDLGGGTFDISIIDSRFGNYDVQATDGIIKGGDDLDLNIRRFLIKNAKIRAHALSKEDSLKLDHISTKCKLDMQKLRKDFYVDLSELGVTAPFLFKEQSYIELMKLTFEKTIIKTRNLIAQHVPYGERFELLLVGGSTHCPYLREWLTAELGQAPAPLTYDPDRVVALGACMYAYMLQEGTAEVLVSDVTSALSVGISDGTVRNMVEKNSKLPISADTLVTNNVESDQLKLDIYQGDSLLQSENEHIGTLIYGYGTVRKPYTGDVFVTMSIDVSGVITVSCKELMGDPITVVLERSTKENV